MNMSAATRRVYTHVIEDVINKVRDEFVNNGGPGEDVLDELQGIWRTKIDNYEGVVNEAAPEMQAKAPAVVPRNIIVVKEENNVVKEETLDEADDDWEDLDDADQGEELDTRDLVLAQFDKVTHSKSKWKCSLKNSIMLINDTEVVFNKVTGEFDF